MPFSLNRKIGLPTRSVFKDIEVVKIGGRVAVRYKGSLYASVENASVLAQILARPKVEEKLRQDVFGPSPPNLFVGEYGYPNVSVGPLVSVDDSTDAELLDSPTLWTQRTYEDIVSFRLGLVHGKRQNKVAKSSAYLERVQEAVMSQKPIDLEMSFSEKPSFSMWFSPTSPPMGPSATVEKLVLAGNPRIPGIVDEVIGEKLLVREAVPELLSHKLDYYYVQKLLSAGILGKERKLVPTKWGITATDDAIAKHYLSEVREFPQVSSFLVYGNDFLHNHFEILLMPGNWEFENFESWAPSTPWMQQSPHEIIGEHEPFEGRTSYAESQGGGYYASRLSVVSALHSMRRQARAVVFREVGEGYTVPTGVWQVRENVRMAMRKKPVECTSLQDALSVLSTRLRHPIGEYLKRSRVLYQKRMAEWF